MDEPRSPPPRSIVVPFGGAISERDLRWLCERVRSLLETDAGEPVVCDLTAAGGEDAGIVEALARMQLTARRLGGRVVVRGAGKELRDLLRLCGLVAALPCEPYSASRGGSPNSGK